MRVTDLILFIFILFSLSYGPIGNRLTCSYHVFLSAFISLSPIQFFCSLLHHTILFLSLSLSLLFFFFYNIWMVKNGIIINYITGFMSAPIEHSKMSFCNNETMTLHTRQLAMCCVSNLFTFVLYYSCTTNIIIFFFFTYIIDYVKRKFIQIYNPMLGMSATRRKMFTQSFC